VVNYLTDKSWQTSLLNEFEKPYFQKIIEFLHNETALGKTIYPSKPAIFNAFNLTPLNKVKAVIIGQDPYHQPNQAHGLSFSVLEPTQPPPSLKNIYKELHNDLGLLSSLTGNLTSWATQGVLLLNASLTVEANKPMSHSKIGWHTFTNNVIHIINAQCNHIVFVLWGSFAQSKASLINSGKHLIIQSAHPSPLSAYNGFWGSKPFSKTNNYLLQHNIEPINWQL
jgi:uracil-DNA glycosylase